MIYLNLFACIIIVFSLFLFNKASGSIHPNKLNTISYVLYREIIPIVIGTLLVANNLVDNHYVITCISNETKIKGYLWVLYSILMMPLSMFMVNKIFNINMKKKFNEYLKKPLAEEYNLQNTKKFSVFFTVVSLATLTYIIIMSPYIPIFTALIKGDLVQASIERISVKRDFGGIIYIKNLLGLYLMPVFTYQSYVFLKQYKTKFFKIIFFINFIATSFLFIYDTQKAPILIFLLGFLIVKVLVSGKLKIIELFLISITALIVIIVLYIYIGGLKLSSLLRFDNTIMYRIFIGQISGYFLSLEWFPEIIKQNTSFIGIPSNILKILDLPNIESARLLMMHFNPEGVKSGIAGLINSYYLGEAWANYGYVGLLISPVIVGFVIQTVHVFLIKSKKTAINIAFYATISIKWLITGGIVNFLYLKQLIFPFILYIFYKIVTNFIYVLGTKK